MGAPPEDDRTKVPFRSAPWRSLKLIFSHQGDAPFPPHPGLATLRLFEVMAPPPAAGAQLAAAAAPKDARMWDATP